MVVTFSDLDDTLFQSSRKCQEVVGHKVAAVLPGGEVGAYSTPQQQALISLLNNSYFIPVTGRRTESLSRIQVSFNSYKITSHGAIILNSGSVLHPSWRLVLDEEEPQWCDRMLSLKSEVEQYVKQYGLELRVRVISDMGYACYVCVKGEPLHLQKLQTGVGAINSDGFNVHCNDRNLAYMPPYASKRRAVTFLKEILKTETKEPITFIGLGDSLSDTGFLSICDFQIIPSNSQIAEALK
jgi:hydroxymethylpyrimidine pyrophosphatase-like HAD family hydrolase